MDEKEREFLMTMRRLYYGMADAIDKRLGMGKYGPGHAAK